MSKKVIAIDIDDVLAAHAEAFIAFTNNKWGTNLTVEDYDEHWSKVWEVDHDETMRRADEFHASGEIARYRHFEQAEPVLKDLSERFDLVIVTSRQRMIAKETEEWINAKFPGIFSKIHHSGLWDDRKEGAHVLTKADVCRELGVSYLIDDQTKHCFAVAELGIKTVLFGDYSWNRADELPENVTRCHDWQAVNEYFKQEARTLSHV